MLSQGLLIHSPFVSHVIYKEPGLNTFYCMLRHKPASSVVRARWLWFGYGFVPPKNEFSRYLSRPYDWDLWETIHKGINHSYLWQMDSSFMDLVDIMGILTVSFLSLLSLSCPHPDPGHICSGMLDHSSTHVLSLCIIIQLKFMLLNPAPRTRDHAHRHFL